MAQTYLTKQSPTAGNRQKGTLSMWVKRSKLGASQYIYSEWQDGQDHGIIYFSSADQLQIISNDGASASLQIGTNRKFRDRSAWYNIVISWPLMIWQTFKARVCTWLGFWILKKIN